MESMFFNGLDSGDYVTMVVDHWSDDEMVRHHQTNLMLVRLDKIMLTTMVMTMMMMGVQSKWSAVWGGGGG